MGETTEERKIMELGIVTDERIANGHYYGRCFREVAQYFRNPGAFGNKTGIDRTRSAYS